MIEADLHIAGPRQGKCDRFGLSMPLETVRQGRFFYLALVFLERRDVGIAEHRKAVGTQFDASSTVSRHESTVW